MGGKQLFEMFSRAYLDNVEESDRASSAFPVAWENLPDNRKALWNDLGSQVVLAPGARPTA
jgi:hypothetical protein